MAGPHLPLADDNEAADPAARACATCHGMCCEVYTVAPSAIDLLGMMRALSLPWDAIAHVAEHPIPLDHGFRLDESDRRSAFLLRRRPEGACQFLLVLEGGQRRCGVHAVRPAACRTYPVGRLWHGPDDASALFREDAICPPEPQAEIYREAAPSLLPLIDADEAERALYRRILNRWDAWAARKPIAQPARIEELLAWVDDLSQKIAPLRTGPAGAWQPAAYQIVDDWPWP